MDTKDRILVGVSGSPGSRAAVRYASHEAARTSAALRIVHVAPSYRPLISLYPTAASVTPAEVEAVGHAILVQASYEAQWYLDESDVERLLLTGERGRGLIAASRDVRMIVLGRTRGDTVRRIATGRLVASVAQHAAVPIVLVPETWVPSQPRGRLLVGLKRLDAIPVALVRAALQLADQRNAALQLVHVATATPDDNGAGAVAHRTAGEAAAHEVRRRLEDLFGEFPAVPVTVEVPSGDPATYLVARSASEDALVISRGVRHPSGGHDANVGSAVLRSSQCPVVVVPVADEPMPTDLGDIGAEVVSAPGARLGARRGEREEKRDEFA